MLKIKNKVIFLLVGLLFSFFSYSTVVQYDDGKLIKLNLSYTNPNYIHVDGDVINTVNFLDENLTVQNASSGGVILNINNPDQSLTSFIQTSKGLIIPIEIKPVDSMGFYYDIQPTKLIPNKDSPKWEKSNNSFESSLIDIAKSILTNSPDLVGESPKGKLPQLNVSGLNIKSQKMFVGKNITVVQYKVTNKSKLDIHKNESDFVVKGVSGVFFDNSDQLLHPKESCYVYIIFSV